MNNMYGSKKEYIVQIRVQDYWVDTYESTFAYLDQAKERLIELQDHNNKDDFKVIKRITSFVDEDCN
jgi:hypothetical protein